MAVHRHKRDTNARKFPKAQLVAGPLAVLATVSTVGLGVLSASPQARDQVFASSPTTDFLDVDGFLATEGRAEVVSRAGTRLAKAEPTAAEKAQRATRKAVRQADTKRWTTADLNLWTDRGRKGEKVGVLESGERVLVTGRRTPDQVEIVWKGKSRWVTAGYLAEEKPDSVGAGDVDATCTNGSAVAAGVSPNIVKVHQAVCANFPEITTYGTFRGDGEHAQGIAVDIMVSGDRGWEVAEFIRAHYAELGVSYLIYSQNIWSVERASEGWRGMSDRGSSTANHYDHVHVTTY